MRKTIFEFKNNYFGSHLPLQCRVFNITHLLMTVVYLLCTGLVLAFLPGVQAFVSCIVMAAFSFFSFYEANRTGRFIPCTVVVSCVMNFVFMPLIFYAYNEQLIIVPIYFVFMMMYNILLLDGKIVFYLTFLDICVYMYVLRSGFIFLPDTLLLGREKLSDYLAALVAIVLVSVVGGIIIRYKLKLYVLEQKKIEDMHMHAMEAYISKDIFLVNMSHEIRTPMNAIVGNINLLLEQNVSDVARENAYGILNSCNALLSLTNEIMDLSKSTNREIVLFNTRYDIGEAIMEVINMMSVRLMDSDVELIVDVDNKIPRYLISDSAKVRQLITNILNNAIKYTPKGHISLRIHFDYVEMDKINLLIDVEDTGKGIDKAYFPFLFDPYGRMLDNNTESSGVGLSICKEIVDKMDGDISVTSEVGTGSIFSLTLPQKIDSREPLINIERPDRFHILIYEKNEDYSERLKQIIENLGIICDLVSTKQDFEDMFLRYHYTHIFIAYDNFLKSDKFLIRRTKDEKIVVISDMAQLTSITHYGYVLTRPVYALSIASVLNELNNNYVRKIVKKGKFICPKAKILIVDDNLTNLNVAMGLLKKYNATILTAISGMECLRILQEEKIDIVFLDYMMPEMDGIDTLKQIRKNTYYNGDKLPVVALTANVVSGAREMFLEAGFNDYIAKPIDIEKIEKCLKTMLPKDYIETVKE